ncbi:hypothetical protein B0I00_1902 [Novosphingobium kunmingense]|uniref:Uncharacterized protein n=1 Tax=Novosphingobium kunmingense TaxID=1211806 RepID=A0A2N0HL48_9SPHN|nr:hypothetical protein [Novosphingobium kunmingense]PKB19662.1 hypothetical protein B0I00_1902 [Novosphingobium kunmingense]
MANRWCDGLGRYGGNKALMLNGSSSQAWAQVSGYWNLSTANPRTGTHCLRLTDQIPTSEARRVFGEPLEEVLFGFALFAHDLPSREPAIGASASSSEVLLAGGVSFDIRDQANIPQLSFILGTDGAIEVRRRPGGPYGTSQLIARTVPVIGAGAYQHVEIYARASNENGAIEIRVDEITRLNLTGIDTVSSSSVEFSQVSWGAGFNGAAPTIDLADFYCNDTVNDGSGCHTFIGDCKSGWLQPNTNTAQADFTLSAGASGYALLDDLPPDDATYIETASATARSDFGLQNPPANLVEVLTARPAVRAMKDDAGTALIAPSLVSNGVKAAVEDQPVTTAFAYYDQNVPFDPDTAAPWDLAGLTAALEAIERTA